MPRFRGLISGQFQNAAAAVLGPSAQFDFELELGVYISKPSKPGKPIDIADVDEHVFGFVLLNDWSGKYSLVQFRSFSTCELLLPRLVYSGVDICGIFAARDIQRAESGGPTGPFLAKSRTVTISPWIITLDALEAARVPRTQLPIIPNVLHLCDPNESSSNIDIRCFVEWSGGQAKGVVVSKGEYRETYWTYRQLLAHQTCNGAEVGTGDLLGTGTMSMFEVRGVILGTFYPSQTISSEFRLQSFRKGGSFTDK